MRIAILIVLLGIAGPAVAESSPEADAHARRGFALYNLGKYEEAIVEFEHAYTLFQSDALLFNLAQAHRQLEHCERALHYYTRFMAGTPTPALATQVTSLLPKLEAACRTKFERPAGPVGPVGKASTAEPERVAAAKEEVPEEAVAVAQPVLHDPAGAPTILVTAAATAGAVISGGTAPTTGIKLVATMPPPWLRGAELGVTAGAARLWRGDAAHNATLAQLAATIRYRASFGWGRVTLAGELGGAYFSSLASSSGVVPGISRAGQWAPLMRGEIGGEHDVAHHLAVRVGLGVGGIPRAGAMLASAGEVDLMIGLRYER